VSSDWLVAMNNSSPRPTVGSGGIMSGTGYVLAFVDAVYYNNLIGRAANSSVAGGPFRLTTRFSASDYIEKLDVLYSDVANVRIPLPFALQYCCVELDGKKTACELELNLLELRRLASTLSK
jgi:hypothetical protein